MVLYNILIYSTMGQWNL